MGSDNTNFKIIAQNKKAGFQYHIDETIEAGLVLIGSEIKSLRESKASLSDSYAMIKSGEAFLMNMHISPLAQASVMNHEPKRTRKLLLHKQQIRKLTGKLKEKGYTLIPIKLYFKKGRAKVELGLCKGKKLFDKRETIKKRETKRAMNRALQK
ncbi:MAG: SsrA-binding protein, partial [Deltaproteobacteria bacterium CG07_land_8_20_14_0_80_38_7]